MAELKELEIPEGLAEETGGIEMVRFWISDGNDHVTLNIGIFDESDEPEMWGNIAADIVKHAVRGMVQDVPQRNEAEIIVQIERAFLERLQQTLNFSGSLSGRA